jgi:hypothetical protein
MDGIGCTWPNKAISHYTQTIEYPRIVFYEEETFSFEISILQASPGQLCYFAHVYIWSFSPSTLRRIKEQWQAKRPLMPRILMAQGDVTDDKWVRWVRMFGFHPLIENVPCTDGELRNIYVNFFRKQHHGW